MVGISGSHEAWDWQESQTLQHKSTQHHSPVLLQVWPWWSSISCHTALLVKKANDPFTSLFESYSVPLKDFDHTYCHPHQDCHGAQSLHKKPMKYHQSLLTSFQQCSWGICQWPNKVAYSVSKDGMTTDVAISPENKRAWEVASCSAYRSYNHPPQHWVMWWRLTFPTWSLLCK
jgi:hypothetical protein